VIGGFAYWEGRVFEKQSGGAKGAGRGELAALHGGIECLAGNAKGAGGLRGAAVAFDKSGNGFINHGGVQRARRRVVVFGAVIGCQLQTSRICQFVAGRSNKGQSVFSMPRAGA